MFCCFFLWCIISIPFSIFYGDIVVMNINNIYTYVKFGFQQVTQLAYLLIGFSTCLICNSLLVNGKLKSEIIIKILDASYIIGIILALLQLILPSSLCTEVFRNSVHVTYRNAGARISGSFGEPSFFSLVCTPFFCGYFYKLVNKFSVKYLLFCTLFILVVVNNQSSAAILGICVGIAFIIFLNLILRTKRLKRSYLITFIFVLIIVSLNVLWLQDEIKILYKIMISKLNGEGISGSERLYSFRYHLNLFLTHPMIFLFGVGYGTIRSFDLLTTWACEVGIIGLCLYFFPIFYLCWKLLKKRTENTLTLLINIVVYNSILFISTCEIVFLQIWIMYGLGFFIISSKSHNSNFNRKG